MYGIDKPICDPYGLIGALSFDMCGSNERCVLFVLLLSVCLSWTRLGGVTGPVICGFMGGIKSQGKVRMLAPLLCF